MANIVKLFAQLGFDSSQFESGIKSAKKAAADLDKSVGDAIGNIASSMSKMAKASALAMTAIGAYSLKASMDFGKAMQNIGSLMPGNQKAINQMSRDIRDLAIQTGQSATDLSAGMYQLVSSFGSSAASMDKLKIASTLAASGLASMTDSVNMLAAETKAYGDTSDAAVQKVADLAAMTVRLGQTTLPELAQALPRVTSLASTMGVSMEELHGTMATFTGVTGNAAEVSTQFRGFLQALAAPTEDMVKLFDQLGVKSGQDLIQLYGLEGSIAAVADAAEKAGTGGLQKLVGSIEGQQFVMAGADKLAGSLATNIRAMGDAAGAAAAAQREQLSGLAEAAAAWDRFKEAVHSAAVTIGDELGPLAADTLDQLTQDLHGAEPAIAGFARSGIEWFRDRLVPAIRAVYDGFKQFVDESSVALKQFFESDIPSWTDALSTAGQKLGEAFAAAFMGVIDKLKERFDNAVNDLLGYLEEKMRRIPGLDLIVGATTGDMRGTIFEASGGYIAGPGTATSDSIPARLSNGEYVIQASAVKRYGKGFMDAVNAKRFAKGGAAGAASGPNSVQEIADYLGTTVENLKEIAKASKMSVEDLAKQAYEAESKYRAEIKDQLGNVGIDAAGGGAPSAASKDIEATFLARYIEKFITTATGLIEDIRYTFDISPALEGLAPHVKDLGRIMGGVGQEIQDTLGQAMSGPAWMAWMKGLGQQNESAARFTQALEAMATGSNVAAMAGSEFAAGLQGALSSALQPIDLFGKAVSSAAQASAAAAVTQAAVARSVGSVGTSASLVAGMAGSKGTAGSLGGPILTGVGVPSISHSDLMLGSASMGSGAGPRGQSAGSPIVLEIDGQRLLTIIGNLAAQDAQANVITRLG